MKQSNFCDFDIKNKFLDFENPHVAIFRHQIAPEMELQHYFQNSGAKFLLEAQNSNRDNLKITWGIRKIFIYALSFFDIFSLTHKFVLYQKHGYKNFF